MQKKKAADGIKKTVKKVRLKLLLTLCGEFFFCLKLDFRGATLHGEKQDAERRQRQNEIKEGEEGGGGGRFQWMSEFLGCSSGELMTGA